jgi:serine/threonine protein kinase
MPQPAAHDDVGSTFGKYFLMKKLAAGGMGEIFLAKQQGPAGFQKILVVKKILSHLTENKEFVEAFLGEARLAAQMNHRNVVQVFELGEESGSYFIAMEYVAGKSLRDVIDAAIKRKEKLHAELCRTVAEQICDGASYAHNLTDMTGRSLNLVHRDLNPQNVLISYTGEIKVIDFGIAKSEMSTVKTEAGMIKGKFVYMSPEQSMAKKLDKRSDIFAIGISLYEMLTGINPFHKNNIVLTLEAVQRYEPPPPSEYDLSYAPFDPIVARALAKDRDRRYSDASEMQDDLRRVVLPRPPERLGQFMARIFRQQLEEEQKMLMDSDSLRLAGLAQKRISSKPVTPSKATPAHATQSDSPVGGTAPLAPRKAPPAMVKPITPPARRPPPPASQRPQGAGDTLIDMGSVPSGQDVDDEVPGGTAMLNPGQALPPPPPRKPKKPTDTFPEGWSDTDEAPASREEESGENRTAFLGTAPARQPARKPQPPPGRIASTNIMTAEESEAAQAEAAAKQAAAQQGLVRTRTRPQPVQPQQSKKGLWIALGVGGLVAVGGIIALLVVMLGDDTPSSPRKRKGLPAPAPQEQAQQKDVPEEKPVPPPEEKRASPVPEDRPRPQRRPAPEENPAPAPEEKKVAAPEQKKPAPRKQIAQGKVLGTLMLNPGASVPVVFVGNPLPKQVGAYQLPMTAPSGTIEVGDATTPFKMQIDYAIAGGVMTVKVNSVPWAIASAGGTTRGRTPVADIKVDKGPPTALELKKPGSDNAMSVRLLYRPN